MVQAVVAESNGSSAGRNGATALQNGAAAANQNGNTTVEELKDAATIVSITENGAVGADSEQNGAWADPCEVGHLEACASDRYSVDAAPCNSDHLAGSRLGLCDACKLHNAGRQQDLVYAANIGASPVLDSLPCACHWQEDCNPCCNCWHVIRSPNPCEAAPISKLSLGSVRMLPHVHGIASLALLPIAAGSTPTSHLSMVSPNLSRPDMGRSQHTCPGCLQDCTAGEGSSGAGGSGRKRAHQHRGGPQESSGHVHPILSARRAVEQLQKLLRVAALLHDLGLCIQILLQALAGREEVHIWKEGTQLREAPLENCTFNP